MQIKKAKAEVERLAASGTNIELVNEDEQPYILVRGIEAPTLLWDSPTQDILIILPVAYDMGTGLDAFYLRLPYRYSGGQHNRVSGQTIEYAGETWQLVSWHYVDGRQFRPGIDNIETHIVHCKGFFWERGATNARN